MAYFKLIIILALSLLLSGCQLNKAPAPFNLIISNQTFQVELAVTDQQKSQGLSGRNQLCANCGMLFVFNPPTLSGFVMRNMRFPLDIIGIKDNLVVDIDQNCQPETGPDFTIYQNQKIVDYVLELNAGTANRLGLRIGDPIIINP